MTSNENLKYCYICSGKIEKKGESFECQNCHHKHYLNPKPCNALIISNDEKEILLVKRSIAPSKGDWDLPGGFIDLNETAEESAVRETKEELKIEITEDKLKYLGSFIDRYEYMGINYHTISFVYTLTLQNHSLTANEEIDEAVFFRLDNIPQNLAFPSIGKAIELYKLQKS